MDFTYKDMLWYLVRLYNYSSQIQSDVGVIRSQVQSSMGSLATISNSLRNGSGYAIDALQALLSNSGSSVDLSKQYFPLLNNKLAGVLSNSGSSVDLLTQYLPLLNTKAGALSQYLPLLNKKLGVVDANVSTSTTRLGTAVDLLTQYLPLLNTKVGALSSPDGVLAPVLANVPLSATRLGIAVDLLTQYFPLFNGKLAGLIDGLETGSTGILQRLGQLPGVIGDAVSSIVGALGNVAITFPDSITAKLAPGVSLPVQVDVAGQAVQSATLWDSVVGKVDTPAIQGEFQAVVGVLRTSFPFGLFFCVSDLFSALAAPPVAPVFVVPLPAVFGDYELTVDLSYFDSVAVLFRGGFVVLYCIGLFSATKFWVYNGGGDSS